MAKKTQKQLNPDDSFFKWYQYHMNHTPGFSSFVKIVLFFIFAIVLIIFGKVAVNDAREQRENYNKTTTIASHQKTPYKTLVDMIVNNTTNIDITIGENKYMIENMKYHDGVLSGLFESVSTTKKFRVDGDTIFEYVLGDTQANPDLFGEVETSIILPKKLIQILESNKATKVASKENVTYTYNLSINEIDYNVVVTIISDKIVSIDLKNETISYSIKYGA